MSLFIITTFVLLCIPEAFLK